MKALVKSGDTRGLELVEKPKPVISPNEVLIRIHKTSLCGTDLHIYDWDLWAQGFVKAPLTVGHEFYGVVEEIGSEVKGLKPRDRVSGEGHITCGHCRNCRAGRRHLCRNSLGIGTQRDGCFAEYLSMPATNLFKVVDSISDDIASIFDPLGNAVHSTLSFDLVGEDVLITGAGPIGIMAAAIARFVGARYVVVSDVNPYRLKIAKEMGATRVVNVQEESLQDVMKDLGMTEGFDVGLEMSGKQEAFSSMLELMNNGGKISLLGIFPEKHVSINWDHVLFKGLQIKGIYGREMFETWYKMSTLLESGLKVDKVITHSFHYEDYDKAFELMRSGEASKITLHWAR